MLTSARNQSPVETIKRESASVCLNVKVKQLMCNIPPGHICRVSASHRGQMIFHAFLHYRSLLDFSKYCSPLRRMRPHILITSLQKPSYPRAFFCQFHPIFLHVKQSILIWTQNSERLNSRVLSEAILSIDFYLDTYSDRLIIMRSISFFGCRVCKVYFLNPCYVFSSFPSLPLLHCFVLFLMQSLHSKICPSLNQMPFRGTHT